MHTGDVVTERIIQNDSITFIGFLSMLDQHVDPSLIIHLVLDNGSSHTSKATKTWLGSTLASSPTTPQHDPGRTRPTFLLDPDPQAAPSRRVQLATDLTDKIENFIIVYNRTAKPYGWTYEGRPLKRPDPRRINAGLH